MLYKNLAHLKASLFLSLDFHLCGVLSLSLSFQLQNVPNGCCDSEDIPWAPVSAKLQGEEEVGSRFQGGASHARTQLSVPPALASLLLDNSFPACCSCFYLENLPQCSQLGASLSLSWASKLFIMCLTYSCLPCNESVQWHVICVLLSNAFAQGLAYASSWCTSVGTGPLLRFKKRCWDSRGGVTPQDWETSECWRQIVFPFHFFS